MWQSEFFSAEVGNCSSGGGASLSLWRRLRGLSDIRPPARPSAVDTEKQTASVSCSLNLRDMLTFRTCAFKKKKNPAQTSKPTGMNGRPRLFYPPPESISTPCLLFFLLHFSVLKALDSTIRILRSAVLVFFHFRLGLDEIKVCQIPTPALLLPPSCRLYVQARRLSRERRVECLTSDQRKTKNPGCTMTAHEGDDSSRK